MNPIFKFLAILGLISPFGSHGRTTEMVCQIDSKGTKVQVRLEKSLIGSDTVQVNWNGNWRDLCASTGEKQQGGKYWARTAKLTGTYFSCKTEHYEKFPTVTHVGITTYDFAAKQTIHRIFDAATGFKKELNSRVYDCD